MRGSTINSAENIPSQHQLEAQRGHYRSLTKEEGNGIDFLAYCEAQAKKRRTSTSKTNYRAWMVIYKHLKTFTQGHCKLEEVDNRFCEALYKGRNMITQRLLLSLEAVAKLLKKSFSLS